MITANSTEPGQSAQLINYVGWPGFILVAKANHFWFWQAKG